jgi:hydroxymethylpyrimidine pyrophosphatase-like HAD family hydrolase
MNEELKNKLVICDLDAVLLDANGDLPQVARDVVQLYTAHGGRVTVFSQRTPRAVRALLGSMRLSTSALVCGGSLVYDFATGAARPLCDFGAFGTGFWENLPYASGVGIALQMKDGATRVLRMSRTLQQHLKQEWTPYFIQKPEDVRGADVLRVLLYQDSRLKVMQTFERALTESAAPLKAEHLGADLLVLTPHNLSGEAMLHSVCSEAILPPSQVEVVAGSLPMLELVQNAGYSAAAADAPAEVRIAAREVTLTGAHEGAAAEYLYGQVRRSERENEKI